MTANLITLNSSKTVFLLNLWGTSHLLWPNSISPQSLLVLLQYHILQLRCIRPHFDSSTDSTIATSTVFSKLDYFNSLYYKLPKSQLFCLQQIQNSLAHTVVKAPKSCHITHPTLSSLAQNHRMHRIQAPLSYLQSSHNYSTSIPS